MSSNQDLNPIVALDATALSEAIHRRTLSCSEVMRAYLDHIDRYNARYNAIVSLRDSASVLAEAEERDRMLANGQSMGWMHGMPQAVKDLAACEGLPCRKGSLLTPSAADKHDSITVSRVRRSGAIFLGKTNTPEFGLGSQTYNPVFGATRNAYDTTRTSGGSSGGAAVAVATRMLPVADGSDMMGSLRNPAGFNNIYGFRPTQGYVPLGPAPELFMQQYSTEGPMGRSVRDIARLLETQAGYDPRVPLSSRSQTVAPVGSPEGDCAGLRVGWLGDYDGYLAMEPEILALCTTATRDFVELGCAVEPCSPDYSMPQLWETWLTLRHWMVAGNLGDLYADPDKRHLLKPEAQWEIEGGQALTGQQVYKASLQRSDWYRAMLKLFDRFDYLLLPTTQVAPFDVSTHWPTSIAGRTMDTYHRWMEVVIGPTLAGLPSLSVPIGFDKQGLPVGLQIIGRPHDDFGVLRLGHAHEKLKDWVAQRLPPFGQPDRQPSGETL